MPHRTLSARFWAKVAIADPDDCWEWKGSLTEKGYGQIHISGRWKRAHRLSWEMANGPIPTGLLVCHHCDNPPCVNPAHLYVGTPADNTHDMLRKGRLVTPWVKGHKLVEGAKCGAAKLTDRKVLEIRAAYAAGGVMQKTLAERYGVSSTNIRHIVCRRTWTHI